MMSNSKEILNRLMAGQMSIEDVVQLQSLPTVISKSGFHKLTTYQQDHYMGVIVDVDPKILSTLLNS